MSQSAIYLDNNATTRVDPLVVERILQCFREEFGNPSSTHRAGSRAAAAIEAAREQVARSVGATPDTIVFTSGGTEADNLALTGVLEANPARRHVVVCAVEHHAVSEHAHYLATRGFEVTTWGVDRGGRPDLEALPRLIRPDTALVVAMLANNETGVVLPLREIVEISHAAGALVMSDAVNALGKIAIDVVALGIDLMAISAHKVHGPKGVGALYIRKGLKIAPLLHGGPQERRRRGGTQNVPGIVGFGAACALLGKPETQEAIAATGRLRERLESFIRANIADSHVIGLESPRLPNTCCVCFADCDAEALLMLLSEAGIYASSGSACSSGAIEASPILRAMGVEPRVARGQIRFSLSRETTATEIEAVLTKLPELVARARKMTAAMG